MNGNGNGARDPETDEVWEDTDAAFPDVDDLDAEAEEWRREQADLRRLLGVDDAFGYHFVDTDAPSSLDAPDTLASDDGADKPRARISAHPIAMRGPDSRGHTRPALARQSFPCLDDGRYSGCLGMACLLETCWTGAATVSFARRMREQSHVATVLYLPGAPCHGCACLHEDEAPAPRVSEQQRRAGQSLQPVGGAGDRDDHHEDEREEDVDAEAAPARATPRRITCTRGLWAHPISLSSFVTKRIPMCDPDEPQHCPGFAPRLAPHPAVAAHLQRRRERARLLREERQARQDE